MRTALSRVTLLGLAGLYADGLAHYRDQDWSRATRLFEQVLDLCPQDRPAQLMRARCRDYQVNLPSPD